MRAIHEFIAAYNQYPKPPIWTAGTESIIDRVRRCKAALEALR